MSFIQNRGNFEISQWNIFSKRNFVFFLFLHKKSTISQYSCHKGEWSAVDKLLSRMTRRFLSSSVYWTSPACCFLFHTACTLAFHPCVGKDIAFFLHLFVGQPEFFHQGFSPCVRASFLAAH